MNTINISADATAQRIGIGNQYENEATAVVFDCSQFAEDHGAGTAQIIHRRPTESIGYVCTNVTQTNNSVTWLVTDDDTSFTGKGQVQLRWYVDDVLRESVIFPTYILPSVASSDDAPAEVKSALEQLMEWVNDNTISIEDLDERIANYFDEHPIPTPVTSVNEKLGDVVLTAEDVGAYSAEEADEKFCVPDGEYEELNAGTAKQLLSDSYTLDQVPYLYRKSPDSDRAVEEIVGGTVGWNQMIPDADAHKSGTVTSSQWAVTNTFSLVSGHKYVLIRVGKYSNNVNSARVVSTVGETIIYSPATPTSGTLQGVVFSCTESRNSYKIQAYVVANEAYDFYLMLTDLTTYFGSSTIADYVYNLESTTAGAGIEWLKKHNPKLFEYNPYSEPTLRSVEGLVRKKTVGFNQWDEEWEYGNIFDDSGNNGTNADIYWRSKNYIPIFPSTKYYHFTDGYAETFRHFFYDSEKRFIGYAAPTVNSGSAGIEFTTPSNACYMRFRYYTTLKNYKNCINLSDPTRNGQYEPYESHSYPLDSTLTLRGVPKLDSNNNLYFDGDIYPSDGQGKRRYGLVDLGTLNWTVSNESLNIFRTTGLTEHKVSSSINVFCADYLAVTPATPAESIPDKACRSNASNGSYFYVRDTRYSDATALKAGLSGIYLLYELATPTTFTAQPYHNPQIVGDTEEFVTTGIVPVGHSTRYYQNLRKKIEGLPWNFSSLIAPTEVTNTATRNYTAGSYLILNNVLYKVTANIANGGNITPNTNVTATTIMSEIMSL